jgi:hypothetical protein
MAIEGAVLIVGQSVLVRKHPCIASTARSRLAASPLRARIR